MVFIDSVDQLPARGPLRGVASCAEDSGDLSMAIQPQGGARLSLVLRKDQHRGPCASISRASRLLHDLHGGGGRDFRHAASIQRES